MQEMETLWKEGIYIFDGFTRQTFNIRAIIFITIHDYQLCVSFRDRSKVGQDARSAWMTPYHLSWKVLER
jgi:hypothetical protein